MNTNCTQIRALISAIVVACALGVPAWCGAQWVPNPGEGAVSLGIQHTRVTKHLFSGDMTPYGGNARGELYMGDIFGESVNLGADYGIWRGLAVSASAVYLRNKYSGVAPEGPEDDGTYHGSLQDASFTAEYMFAWEGFAITPSVGAEVPIRDYSRLGHSALGGRLRALPLGISVGRSLDPLLPRAYLAGSFSYSTVEKLHGYNLDNREFGLSGGYILTKSISVGGSVSHFSNVGGIDWFEDDLSGAEMWADHDAAAKAKYVRGSGYVNFSLRHDIGVRISYIDTISGENTHNGRSITITPSWSFRTPFAK